MSLGNCLSKYIDGIVGPTVVIGQWLDSHFASYNNKYSNMGCYYEPSRQRDHIIELDEFSEHGNKGYLKIIMGDLFKILIT